RKIFQKLSLNLRAVQSVADNARCLIGRPVIDDDELGVGTFLREIIESRANGVADPRCFIETGNGDGEWREHQRIVVEARALTRNDSHLRLRTAATTEN